MTRRWFIALISLLPVVKCRSVSGLNIGSRRSWTLQTLYRAVSVTASDGTVRTCFVPHVVEYCRDGEEPTIVHRHEPYEIPIPVFETGTS